MRFSRLVEHVSKKPLPLHSKHLLVEVMLTDEQGEDVEVSRTLYLLTPADLAWKVPFVLVRI